MSDDLDQVRRDVAALRRLPAGSEKFLTGENVEAIENQAIALRRLVEGHRSQEPAQAGDPEEAAGDPLRNILANAHTEKHRRHHAILQALGHRRPDQPRDAGGRFAPTAGFDGGARMPLPQPSDPVADHNDLVAEMSKVSRTFGTTLRTL
jgi:hypothetical protein